MVRLLFRQPRADDPPVSQGGRPFGLAVVAVVTGIALVGCGGIARDAKGESAANTRASGGMSAVAPQSEQYATDSSAGAGTSSKAGGAAPGVPTAPLPALGEVRSIIRTGSIDLTVKSVAQSFEVVRQVAEGAGGMVADSSFTGTGEEQTARLTIRVPSDRFGDTIAKLREAAVEVRQISTGSNDVTDEVVDLEATVRNLRAVEAQYVQMLGRANTLQDVLTVQDRINQTRLQIDRTEARRQSLTARAEMSTINVSLSSADAPAPVEATGLLADVRAAWSASLATLATLASTVAVVLVYSWWMIPIVALAVVLVRRNLRGPVATPATPSTSEE
ncbi:MAG: DUF4349 domain-containing protein [Dehalococcoidia bacterium]